MSEDPVEGDTESQTVSFYTKQLARGSDMDKGFPSGLAIIEKFFGVIILILGILILRYTQQTHGLESIGYGFFIFFGVVLIGLGAIITITKVS